MQGGVVVRERGGVVTRVQERELVKEGEHELREMELVQILHRALGWREGKDHSEYTCAHVHVYRYAPQQEVFAQCKWNNRAKMHMRVKDVYVPRKLGICAIS